MKNIKAYLFELNDNDECVLLGEALIYPTKIERIICKRKVQNRKTEYEEVEISTHSTKRQKCLVKRNQIPRELLCHIITFSNGTRTVQKNPYTNDILDLSLLDELEIEVLTYKHYYFLDDFLADCYLPIDKNDPKKEEIILKNKKYSEKAIEDARQSRERKNKRVLEDKIDWRPITKT